MLHLLKQSIKKGKKKHKRSIVKRFNATTKKVKNEGKMMAKFVKKKIIISEFSIQANILIYFKIVYTNNAKNK